MNFCHDGLGHNEAPSLLAEACVTTMNGAYVGLVFSTLRRGSTRLLLVQPFVFSTIPIWPINMMLESHNLGVMRVLQAIFQFGSCLVTPTKPAIRDQQSI
jgi:hypothetical protein